MSNNLKAINFLEENLKKLIFNYEFLKKENSILIANNSKLQLKLNEKQLILEHQKKEIDVLRIAKTIDGSSTNTKDTKLKINSLIREIDKCIVQLQE